MNAAERLFLDQGVASTTIEQITAGAGVAKGSFYLHFSSKEDVVGGLRQRFVATLLDTIKAAVERRADGDWSGKLAAWAAACGRGYAASARLHEIVFHDVPPPSLDGLADNILIDDLTRLLADGDQERPGRSRMPASRRFSCSTPFTGSGWTLHRRGGWT